MDDDESPQVLLVNFQYQDDYTHIINKFLGLVPQLP